jgi:hypothetical protein
MFGGASSEKKVGNKSDGEESGEDEGHRSRIWHPQQEKLLQQWGEVSSSFRWMHEQAHRMYKQQNMCFVLPVIILSSITGTLNFAQSSFPSEWHSSLPIFIGSLNLISGMVSTIASFLRVSELSEGNRVAAMSFGKLARNIRVELLLPTSERTADGRDFIAMCRAELDRLTEQTPDIPQCIEDMFIKKFDGQEFYRPEMTDLHPVEIYSDDQERKDARVANVVANAAFGMKQRVVKHNKEQQRKWPKVLSFASSAQKHGSSASVSQELEDLRSRRVVRDRRGFVPLLSELPSPEAKEENMSNEHHDSGLVVPEHVTLTVRSEE